ncbi:hypothetical protein WJX73_010608 [Symbiochloris irregularis]|uniref:Uncharacterized protein n=1 Tax=Symbiochloris irregularis TaxID=706552 RepID=A0AAW1NX83_9CHLO
MSPGTHIPILSSARRQEYCTLACNCLSWDSVIRALRRGHSGRNPLLPQSDTFEGFIQELRASIDRHPLPNRTIDVLFGDEYHIIHPACNGDWMEFGVLVGTSINKTAKFRSAHCPSSCPPTFGFEHKENTFTETMR